MMRLFYAAAIGAIFWVGGLAGAQIRWAPLNEPGCGGWITSLSVSPHDPKRVLVGGDMLGIGLSTDRGEHWQSTFGLPSWEVGDFTWHPTDPNIVWAGTMSGPVISVDGGIHWQLRREGMPPTVDWMYSAPIEKVLFDSGDANHLLAFGGSSRRWQANGTPAWGAVWESRDAGRTWKRLSTINGDDGKGRNIVGAAFAAGSSSKMLAVVDQAGVFASTDGGRTWKASSQGLPHLAIERVVPHPKDPQVIWACLNAHKAKDQEQHLCGGIYKSTDGGATWKSASGNLPAVRHKDFVFTSQYKGFTVSPSNPDVMYVTDCAWNAGVVWKTVDGGVKWQAVAAKRNVGQSSAPVGTAYPVNYALSVMAVDPANADVVLGGGSEFVIRSLDGGKSWLDVTAEAVSDSAWRGRGYSGLCSITFKFDPYRKGRSVLAAMDAGKCWESLDDLSSWTFHGKDPSPWGGGNDIAFAPSGATFVSTGQFGGHGSVLRTLDGKTWTTLGEKNGLPKFEGAGVATGICARPDDPKQVWVIFGGRMFHSTDSGDTWSEQTIGSELGWIAADPAARSRFYVSGKHNVYVTEDGKTFTPIGGPKVAGRMAVDRDGHLYIAAYRGERGGLWHYADKAWTRLLDEPMISNVAVDPADPQRIAVITNDDPFHDVCRAPGVLISADAGRTWSVASEGMVMTRGHAIAFNPFDHEQMVCGTNGRGYFTARWPASFSPKGSRVYAATPDDTKFAAVSDEGPKNIKLTIRNGGMTQGLNVPAEWNGKFGEVEVARDTDVFKVGPASLRVHSSGKSGMAFQTFECEGRETFTVTGWVKSSGKVKVSVAVQSFDAKYSRNNFEQVKYLQNDAEWAEFKKTVTIPEWGRHFNIGLLVEGEGNAWLDEVRDAGGEVDAGKPVDPLTSEPPAAAKPWKPGWGFYPQYPKAWQIMHNQYLERTKKGDVGMIFLGDSITQGWDKEIFESNFGKYKAVNYGIGGDSTRQVLWRIEHGEIEGIKPRLVVLMIGTNNLYGDHNAGTDEEIAKGIETIVATLRKKLPETKVLLLGILPRQNEFFSRRAKAINAITCKLDDGKSVRFLDMSAQFEESLGKVKKELYVQDQLHLAKRGYETWAKTMRALLEEMLKE